jgi:hypothetical protein
LLVVICPKTPSRDQFRLILRYKNSHNPMNTGVTSY